MRVATRGPTPGGDPRWIDITALVQRYAVPPAAVWVMPLGITAEQVGAGFGELADAAISAGYNVSHRLHVLA